MDPLCIRTFYYIATTTYLYTKLCLNKINFRPLQKIKLQHHYQKTETSTYEAQNLID